MTTALILDPALHSMGGHHYNAAARLVAELDALGVDNACYVALQASKEVQETFRVVPTFRRSVYWRSSYARSEFRENVRITRSDLRAALPHLGRSRQLVIMPCCDQVLALALARQLPRWPWRPEVSLIAWLMFAPHHKRAVDDPLLLPLWAEYHKSFAALRSVIRRPDRLLICCETKEMAKAYQEKLNLDVDVVPGPNLFKQARQERPADVAVRVICIGFANEPKGYHFLPGAIALVRESIANFDFHIHGIVEGSDCMANRGVFEALAAMPAVTISNDVLDTLQYQDWMERADLVLLPYDPIVYRARGSGVFNEASRLGVPVVATEGCGFAVPAFAEGRGQPIRELTAKGIAEALLEAVARISLLKEGAQVAARTLAQGRDPVARVVGEGLRRLEVD